MNRAKKSQNSVLHTLERILTSRSSILNQDKGFRKASYLWRFDLLPILAKRIIFNIDDEIVNHELNLLLLYLRSLLQNLSTPGAGMVVRNMSDQGYLYTIQIFLPIFFSNQLKSQI